MIAGSLVDRVDFSASCEISEKSFPSNVWMVLTLGGQDFGLWMTGLVYYHSCLAVFFHCQMQFSDGECQTNGVGIGGCYFFCKIHDSPTRQKRNNNFCSFRAMFGNVVILRQHLADYVRNIQAADAGGAHSKSCKLAEDLSQALTEEFELPRRRPLKALTIRQMQKKLQRAKQQKEQLEADLQKYTGKKTGGRIELMWYIRTSFADPSLSLQSLSSFCRDFGILETPTISSTRIAHAKDAMVEVIKQLNREILGAAASEQPCLPGSESSEAFIIKHVHDEATMGLRSYNPDARLAGRIIRGKYSKVQNNVVEVSCSNSTHFFYQELQSLLRKDGKTIAFALRQVVEGVLSALLSRRERDWKTLRLVHCLTGDGIGTNGNAARRLLRYFQDSSQFDGISLQYSLLCVRCASHAANLCVQVGIVGELQRDPVNTCDLTAACSRWFKYILPSNIEEIHLSFRQWLEQHILQIGGAGGQAGLQDLYGKTVLPDSLLSAVNAARDPHKAIEDRVQDVFKEISRACFIAQEKPVPTRFFLFSSCATWLQMSKVVHNFDNLQ